MNTKQQILFEFVKKQTFWGDGFIEKLVVNGSVTTGKYVIDELKPPLSNFLKINDVNETGFDDIIKIEWIEPVDQLINSPYFSEIVENKLESLKEEEKQLLLRLTEITNHIKELEA